MATTPADVKAEAPLFALASTVRKVEAENLYETLSNMKTETLAYVAAELKALTIFATLG